MAIQQALLAYGSSPAPLAYADDYATIFAAYSAEKKVIRAYSGPLIRVRRASDSAEIDVGFTGAGTLDTAALLTHTGAANGFVTKVYNQVSGGAATDLAQTNVSDQPRIVNGGVVEPDYIWHNGTSDYMLASLGASGLNSTAATLFTKIRIDSTNSNGQYGGAIDLGYNVTSNVGCAIYSETRAITGSPGVSFPMSAGSAGPYMSRSFKDTDRASHGAAHVFTVRFDLAASVADNTSVHAYMDGSDAMQSTPVTGNPNGTFNGTSLYTGRFQYGAHLNRCGLHSLVIVASDALSVRSDIEAVL